MSRLIRAFSGAVGRRLSHRHRFQRKRDWCKTLYDALLRYFKRAPLPGRGRSAAVRLRGVDGPVHLRLGSSDGFVLEEIFVAGVYDCVTSADLGEIRQVVDLGANTGLSVRLWMHRYPQARIIAVEPDEQNALACQRNIDSGTEPQRVALVRACVAGSPRLVYLDRSAEECAFRMTGEGGNGSAPVEAIPLPTILQRCSADSRIDLLKVDIEGAEQEVFADCAGWLGRVRNLMIELHPPYTREQFLADLERGGGGFELAWSGITAGNDLLFLKRRG